MDVFDKILAQQPAQRTAVWMVGEQLADIIRHDPAAQESKYHSKPGYGVQRHGDKLTDLERQAIARMMEDDP